MRKSTNFRLNLVEGNDLVNPLVQDVPNYEKIDEQMYINECNSIGVATELKSGTVHALTRQIPNAGVFRFQATSNFTSGDTFTVDGIQVSALTPSGETLASGCYIIGSEVLCTLRETLLTVYVSGGGVTTAQDSEKLGGQLPEYYGTAEDVSQALTTAQSANQLTLNLQSLITSITSKGILTYNSDTDYFGMEYDGKWNDIVYAGLQRHYYFNDGQWLNTSETGAWSNHSNTSASLGNDNVVITGSSSLWGYYATANQVSLSRFSKLVVECSVTGPDRAYFGCANSRGAANGTSIYSAFTQLSTGTNEINISSVTSGYLVFTCVSNTSVRVTKIYVK